MKACCSLLLLPLLHTVFAFGAEHGRCLINICLSPGLDLKPSRQWLSNQEVLCEGLGVLHWIPVPGTHAAATYPGEMLDRNKGVRKVVEIMEETRTGRWQIVEAHRDSSVRVDKLWKLPLEGWLRAWPLSTFPMASDDFWQSMGLDHSWSQPTPC